MKNLSVILILSFLHYCLGCYSTKVLKNEEAFVYSFEKTEPIYVKTKERITYFYASGTYKLENDTLYGYGQRLVWDEKQPPEPVNIACTDILQIEIKKSNYTPLIVVYTVVTVVVLVAFGSVLSGFNDWGNKN
jgi:hypothetical protein